MPKLQQIVSTGTLPAVQSPRMNGSVGGSVAEGIARIGETVSKTFVNLAEIEERRRTEEAKGEAHLLASQMELALKTTDQTLRAGTIDPDEYMTAFGKETEKAARDVMGRAKSDLARRALEQKKEALVADLTYGAMKHRNELVAKKSDATLAATHDAKLNIVGSTAIEDRGTLSRLFREGLDAAADSATAIGLPAAEKRAREYRDGFYRIVAGRHIDADPEGFRKAVESDSFYRGMDPEERRKLVKESRVQEREQAASWEAWFKRVEDEAEQERKGQVLDLEARILAKQATVKDIDLARAMRVIETREEYDALYTAATREREQASNPDVLQRLSIAAHSVRPTVRPEEVDAAFKRGDLNRKDWKELKDKIISRYDHLAAEGRAATGEARAVDNQQRSIRLNRHSQAEQDLRTALGIVGQLDKYDAQDKQLLDLAQSELTSRSNAYDGREDPITAGRDIAARLRPIRQERLKMSVQTIGQTLRFPAQSAAEAMARLNQNRARMQPAEVAQEERKIADMTRAEGFAASTTEKAGATGKSLRPSGTKPEGGKADSD